MIKIKIIEKTLNKGEIIPLTFDPIFTNIFNNEENICILEDFISIYFDIPINEVIGNLRILSRKLNKNNKLEASKEVDLLLSLNGIKINIELSNRCTIGVRERNLVYICGQHSKQLKVGDKNYQNIKDSIQICINNFNCNENDAIESYYLMNKRGKIYSKKLRIDLIDLEKIKNICYPISNKRFSLFKIFTTNKKVELVKYLEGGIMRDESKEKLIKNVERYSSDEDVFTLYTELSKSELESLAKKLMFEMNDDEYETLEKEFDVILKQMDLIGNIKDIDKVEPMTFPFDLELNDNCLREDVYNNEINFNDMKINVKDYEDDRVKVPKVVE